jgi:hypothetical protein
MSRTDHELIESVTRRQASLSQIRHKPPRLFAKTAGALDKPGARLTRMDQTAAIGFTKACRSWRSQTERTPKKAGGLEHLRFIKPGDVIELEVERSGILRNCVVSP